MNKNEINLNEVIDLDEKSLKSVNGGWDEEAMETGHEHGEAVANVVLAVFALKGIFL